MIICSLKKIPVILLSCLIILFISFIFGINAYPDDLNLQDKEYKTQSAYETRNQYEQQADKNPFGVALYYLYSDGIHLTVT